jgi:tyrosine-specific transport protein
MQLIGCVCLVAGTAIGAGMLALPITLAKFGLLYSTLIMLGTWCLCYLSALLNLELNLRVGKGLPLGALGMHFSGIKSYILGSLSLLILCYALLCAYIYGGASTLVCIEDFPFSFNQAACGYAFCLFGLMLCSIKKVDYLNRFLFSGKVFVTVVILAAALFELDLKELPLTAQAPLNLKDIYVVLPIVFTSFGFQVIFHTLVKHTNGDKVMLKKAFFWGSLLPAILYIAWTSIVCGLIYMNLPNLFHKMLFSSVEVGEILQALCSINDSSFMQYLTWAIGFFAVLTSTIGVTLGLVDALKTKHPVLNRHIVAVFAAVVPSLIIALMVPNAFINALSFAGMILSFMALLLPVYLLVCSNRQSETVSYWYPVLKNPVVLVIISVYGLCVIYSEIQNIFIR